MLVEFKRVITTDDDVEGDQAPEVRNPPIAINVSQVSAVFGSDQDGADVTVVRVLDRGFKVQGTYAEVLAKINGTQVGR